MKKEKSVSGEKKFNLKELFNNRTFLFVLSLALSILIWALVVFGVNAEFERVVSNVPVNLTANNAAFRSLGLDINDRSEIFVTVRVTGPRAVVGTLTPDSITVVPNYSRVDGAGIFTLNLTATFNDSYPDLEIVSVEPRAVTLSFDASMSQRFAVEPQVTGVKAAEGFVIETITASPSEVRITGPQNEISQIARVVVRYHSDQELTSTLNIDDCPLVLLDQDGNELPQTLLTFDYRTADLRIPIYKTGTLPLKLGFTNIPDGFDLSTLQYVMSVESLEISGPAETIDKLQPWTIGYVDLANFRIGEAYEFVVELPTDLINRGPGIVTVTFPRDAISSKKITVTDIRIENLPANFDASLQTMSISDVTVIGPPGDVAALLPGSVVAIIDFSTLTVENGTRGYPVKFIVTANNTTFVVGSYTVYINVVAH